MSDSSPVAAGDATAIGRARSGTDKQTKKTIFTSGSVIGALAMSSCCILPLVLFSLGVTGAWLGNLTALYPYKYYFLVPTAGFLAGSFYLAYREPKAGICEEGTACAAPISERINKIALWSATVLIAAAMAFPYVAPVLLDV